MSYHFYDMGFKDGYKKALQQLDEQTQNLQEQYAGIDWSQVNFNQQQWASVTAGINHAMRFGSVSPRELFVIIRSSGVQNLNTARQMLIHLHNSGVYGNVGLPGSLAALVGALTPSAWSTAASTMAAHASAMAAMAESAGVTIATGSGAGLAAYVAAIASLAVGSAVGWYFRENIEQWVLDQFGFMDLFTELGIDPYETFDIPDELIRDHSNIEKVDPQGELGTRPNMLPYGYQGDPGDASAISNCMLGGGG